MQHEVQRRSLPRTRSRLCDVVPRLWATWTLALAALSARGVAAVRGDPACWTDGFTFEYCCADQHGPFGRLTCWDNPTLDLGYLNCCGKDPEWSAANRPLQVVPIEAPAYRLHWPRFDLTNMARVLEYFLASVEMVHASRKPIAIYMAEEVMPTCARLVFVSDRLAVRGLTHIQGKPLLNVLDLEDFPEGQIAESCFIIFYESDDDHLAALRRIRPKEGTVITAALINKLSARRLEGHKARYAWTDKHALAATHASFSYSEKMKLSFSSNWGRFESICQMLDSTKDVAGSYVEVGVFQGAASRLALEYQTRRKKELPARHFHLVDQFQGFNGSTDGWLKVTGPQGAMTNLGSTDANVDMLHHHLADWKGQYSVHEVDVTLGPLPDVGTVAAANVDCDSYDAVLASLKWLGPLMAVGGMMRIDDAISTPSLIGSLLAVDEFHKDSARSGRRFTKVMSPEQYYLIRTS
eukprot:TRINITY_DN112307_c0_g1_i1.p1 TRINITY_DN112307_c0_g1~~TRINITY_DN112307_c0_g1_i1.p1  ORF type:complete len:481 (-),score=61.58 TRINITY_DN112307_c0_g1_i1:414-1811(-)